MNEKMKNPWRGLQAYREGEILYGRDEDILRLSGQVLSDTDTVLYGKSGIGKSSLLNAGVIPAARRKGVFPVSIRLEHRAGARSYVGQVQYALEEAGVAVRPAHPTVSREASFWEFVHCNRFYIGEERQKLLVIFDQFEEIFTLQQDIQRKRQFFEEMADLLNDIMPRSIAEISGRKEKETEAAEISDAGDLDLDNCFTEMIEGERVYIDYPAIGLRVYMDSSDEFTHMQVFTPKDKPFFCVEKQTCSTDAVNMDARGFEREAHLLRVAPGGSMAGYVDFTYELGGAR